MVSELRTAMAPTVPQIIACCCRCLGTLLAASAITLALSPASTKSIRARPLPDRLCGFIHGLSEVKFCACEGAVFKTL